MKRLTKSALLCSAGILIAPAAFAQNAPASPPAETDAASQASTDHQETLSDIIVTARKRAETIQSVPVSISVVGADQLARQQVVELRDLQRSTGSLQFAAPSGSAPGGGAVIRGIGTVGFSRGAEASVGVVVDGVVQGNTNINNLFDLSRVEVLKGPQGTLFGQSTSAGVINITTVAPSFDKIEGKISTELSGDGFAGSEIGRQVLRAAINLPLAANQAVRISAYGNHVSGVTRNAFTDKDSQHLEGGVRARYLGQFGDNINLNLIGDYAKTRTRNGIFQTYYSVDPGTPLEGYLLACGVVAGPRNFSTCNGSPNHLNDDETYGISGQLDIGIGSHTLTSITAYRRQNSNIDLDVDGLPDGVTSLNVSSQVRTQQTQFTQELRLASPADQTFSYVIGAFFQTALAYNPQLSTVQIDLSKVFPGGPTLPPSVNLETEHTRTSNLSGFGEARFKATDELTFFAGARINRNRINGRATQTYYDNSQPGGTNAVVFRDTDVSWRAGFQFRPNPTVMIYGSASRGYKGGQVSILDLTRPGFAVQPEKPMDFELGVKSNLLNDRLAVNVNLFHTNVKNYQTQTCTVSQLTGQLLCVAENVSKVITKGVEADIFGRPFPGLTLNANLSYNHATYPNDFVGFGGVQVAFAPRFKATVSGEYARPVGNGEAFISLDGTRQSQIRLDIVRPTDDLIYPHSFVWGGRIGYRVTDAWSLALFGKNLGKVAVPSSFGGSAATPIGQGADTALWAYFGEQSRRIVGLQAELKF